MNFVWTLVSVTHIFVINGRQIFTKKKVIIIARLGKALESVVTKGSFLYRFSPQRTISGLNVSQKLESETISRISLNTKVPYNYSNNAFRSGQRVHI